MTDLDDMRRRAAQQASYGNPWAGKVVGLIDRVRELEAERAAVADVLRRCAEGRREYAQSASDHDAQLLGHEASVLSTVADALAGDLPWDELVAIYAPSWRWHEFGEHDPTPRPKDRT